MIILTADQKAKRIAECEAEEKRLKKCTKAFLKTEVQRHYKIRDLSQSTKWDLIGDLLRAMYGVKILKQCKGWY